MTATCSHVEPAPATHEDIQTLVECVQELADEMRVRTVPQLSQEEHEWVKLAIQRESQSIKLRQAIIEKTLVGLVWMMVVGIGVVFLEFLRAHGWKG